MVAMMMMTFLFFFCFVINVGMLVNAKIQLQNAADLAAYAGAAVQARQLNTISYLNYEMRRQYKKFLFRYYVFGNMAQKQFPTGDTGNKPTTPYDWSPDASAGAAAAHFQVPAVCLIFNSNDNYCQVNKLPKIDIPKASSFDLINDALRNSLANLEQLRKDNCSKIALTNMYTLALWLYSGDPDASPDFGLGTDPKLKNVQTVVEGLVKGLGLVPREVLLRMRIETLKKYLNEPPKAVNAQSVESLLASGDPHHNERSIQAFKSAFYTLGDHTFSSDGIVMEELQSPAQIELSDNKVKFDTWAIYFDMPTGPSGKPNPDATGADCVPHLVPQSMKSEVVVGVAKDPKLLTYYAVRLRAKAKLLFNPWGADGIELKAYAAAQPFGSRIGPDLKSEAWVRVAKPDDTLVSSLIDFTNNPIIGQVPNLPIGDDGLNMGWNTTEVLGALMGRSFPASGTGAARQIGPADLARAYQLAMAPNPYETKFYNIPNDLNQNNPQSFLPSVFDTTGAAIYWAPIAPPDSASDVDSQLQSSIEDLFHAVDKNSSDLKDTLKAQLTKYVNGLKGGDVNSCGTAKLAANLDDSDCESFNMVRITNPLRPRPMAANNGSGASLLQLPPWFMPQTAKEVLTSWNSPNDPAQTDAGRMGYSVKFISFDSLTKGKVGTDSKNQTPLTNPPGADDSEAKIDMPSIQH